MKIVVDIPHIRVVLDADYKGVPAIYLDMLGQYVLYKPVTAQTPEEADVEADQQEGMLRSLIGRMFGEMLLEHYPHLKEKYGWGIESPNREIDYHSPAYDQIGDI
jgi:hypothetical protein